MDLLAFGVFAGLMLLIITLPEPYITHLETIIYVVTIVYLISQFFP